MERSERKEHVRHVLGATSFNGNISTWDVSSAIDMNHMFSSANAFDHDLSRWDISSVADTKCMFDSAECSNGDLSE